jgi:uncharacterized protein (TIGR03437 family)
LFIADVANNRIREVSNGFITTVAGNGTRGYSGDGGPAIAAQLNSPAGIAIDRNGALYIADSGNNRIRKVVNGTISTFAGTGTPGFSGDNGPAAEAELNFPIGVLADPAGNIYIADTGNSRVREVSSGVITTVDGGGRISQAPPVSYPVGLAIDSNGNLYVSDPPNQNIRRLSRGVVTIAAGNGMVGFGGDNGPATLAQLWYPSGLTVDAEDNLYIADSVNTRVRRVSNGVITTVAGGGNVFGDGGPAAAAELEPEGLAADLSGNVYVSDMINNRLRVLTPGAPPSIGRNGIVPIYSSVPVVQPGSWVSIYGTNLAGATSVWNGDFPVTLGGTSVTVDGKPAYLWVVSPTQINMQVPDDATTGVVAVSVTTPFGTAASTVTLAPYGPSFSLLGDGKHVAGVIPTPNGTGAFGGGTYDLVGPPGAFSFTTRPVQAGETLVLYGVGFGPTTPAVPAGSAFSGAAVAKSPVTVTIGGANAPVAFAGITEAGLYQINLTVPPNTGGGDQPVVASVNGFPTPTGAVVTVQ